MRDGPDRGFERDAVITGIGLSEIGRRLARPVELLTLDACRRAIADAGLVPGDIDGLATMGDVSPRLVKQGLGLDLGWIGTSGKEGSGGHLRFVVDAAMAVASGLCRHVLVYRSVRMLSGEVGAVDEDLEWSWHHPYHDYSAAGMVARYARRHMHEHGTTREQLGAIALVARENAARNEAAVLRTPITMDDYLGSRPVAEPLGLLDCDLPVDGAAAFAISHAAYADDAPAGVARLEAVGTAIHGTPTWDGREDYPAMAGTHAARQMWSRTDLTPADVDVAQIYDGFTFLALTWIEALGFCAGGEGGPFVEGGTRIGRGGELPINTYGGQLSAGRLHGYWVLHEAVLQLRGAAGARQVPGAEVAVVTAGGGHRMGCLLLTA